MKIAKAETQGFENYEVFCTRVSLPGRWSLPWAKPITYEHRLTGVLEADEETGFVVRQIYNERHEPIYTNGADQIAIDNSVKILLLLPPVREAFIRNGFRPKTVSTYEPGVRIVNRNVTPPQVPESATGTELGELEELAHV